MHAVVGDRLHVHGNVVGHPDRIGEILEVRDTGGEPPYLVRFDDGHTCLVFPGPDAVIEHPRRKPAARQSGSGQSGSRQSGSRQAAGKTAARSRTAKA
jgi:hypothetical protein